MELYLHSHIRLHGMMLHYLSLGTTLILPLPLPLLLIGQSTRKHASVILENDY
jgi:hypothetical protein